MAVHINDLSYSPIIVKKGDKGDKVKKIHWILTQLGYQCDSNDIFGLKTYNGIIKFQLDHNMPINGIVNQDLQRFFFKEIQKIQKINNISFTSEEAVKIGYFTKENNFFITSWSNEEWQYIIRPKTNLQAESIIHNYKQCFLNYNILYAEQTDNSFYSESKNNNMNFSNIAVLCNTNDIELIKMCCIASGESEDILNYSKDYSNFIDVFQQLKNFMIIDSYNYTNNQDYLKHGDILVSNKYIALVLTDGKKVDQIAPITAITKTYKVKTIANKLNIRSIPSKKGFIVSQVKKNTICTIVEEREGWGKIKSGFGWIDLNYVEKL